MNCGVCTSKTVERDIPGETKRHPCYSFDAHHTHARMHLPVAPKCNISCNYCNRKFDCVNESRPGVTSEVLTSAMAEYKFKLVKEKVPNLSVVGIAGPGDALANWQNTKQTLSLIRESDLKVIFCLSTNGLMLPQYAREIVAMGIKHVTVTVNCVEPKIGANIYRYVNYQGKTYTGAQGAEILLRNQLAGIEYLTRRNVLVKVNIVMIKGINDQHIPAVVKKVKELGAFITNIMPLIPAQGSALAHYPQTSTQELNAMRQLCEVDLQQMHHCRQCRADAIGLLGEDRSAEFRLTNLAKAAAISPSGKQYKIAVTSKYGKLVDQHFGHAAKFTIYQVDGQGSTLVETRRVSKYCAGVVECDDEEARREGILAAIQDCDAVLTMRIGYNAKERLLNSGIYTVESCDTVESGLNQAIQALNNHRQGIA